MPRRIVPFLFLAIALPLFAQEPPPAERCRPTDTPRECFERWVPAAVTNPEAPAAQAVTTQLALVNDGISDLNAPVLATLKNFLGGLSGSLDTSVIGEDSTGVAFGYTPPLDVRGHLRFEVKFTKPQLSSETLSTVTDPDEVKKLEASLSALDDVKSALSYDWTSRLVGRDVRRHRALLTALVAPPGDAQSAFVQALVSSGIAAGNAERSLQQLGVTAVTFEGALRGAMTPTQIEADFASLLNNQPQVYGTGYYTARRDIVGPWEFGGELVLELSGRNLNGFYRNEGRNCGTACGEAFNAYLARVRNPRYAPRIALSGTYSRVESTADDVSTLTYKLSAGVPFTSLLSGKEGRLEAGLEYEGGSRKFALSHGPGSLRSEATAIISPPIVFDAVTSPTYERGVAAVTFTQTLSDRVSIPVSLVYRELEYAVTVDERTSIVREHESAIHVGLRYRIVPPRPSPRPCCCC